jgi:hypothetical protein
MREDRPAKIEEGYGMILKTMLAAALLTTSMACEAQVRTGHYDVADLIVSAKEYDRLTDNIMAPVKGRLVTRVGLHTTDGTASWRSGDLVPTMSKVTYTADGKSVTNASETFVGVTIEIVGDQTVKLTNTRNAQAVIAEANLDAGPTTVRRLYATQDAKGRLERHLLTISRVG